MQPRTIRTTRIRSFGIISVLVLLATASNAQPSDTKDAMSVEEISGAVRYRSSSPWLTPGVGLNIKLPAVISTGDDGAIKLRQSKTVVAVSSNTALEIFAGTEPGSPIQRVVQSQGSAFYDIESRESGRMRVETPYLVAVIKGTQFNVTTSADSSTISLFEGRLQVEAPDIGDVVDLHAGQIAKRHKDDTRITVIRMESGEPIARNDARGSSSGEQGQDGNSDDFGDAGNTGTGVDGTAGAGLQVDANGIEGGAQVGVNLPGVTVGVGSEIAAGGGKIDLGLDGTVGLNDLSADLGLATSVSAGNGAIDVGVDSGIGVGDAAVDLGVQSSIDLGSGEIDLGLDSGIDAGIAPIDLGVDAGVDLDAGAVDVDLGVSVVDIDLDLGLEVDTGDILDLGLDELVDDTTALTTPLDDITDSLPDLGGLLGL